MNDCKMPLLEPPQVAVTVTERSTGKVMTFEGRRFGGEGIPYKVFGRLEEAEAFARDSKLDASVEFNVFGYDGKFIAVLSRTPPV